MTTAHCHCFFSCALEAHLLTYLLKAFRMARVNEGSQFYLPPTCLSTNGMSHPALTPQPQHITALWPVLVFRLSEGRRLSWPGWLVTYRGGMPAPKTDSHPSQYQPTDSAAGRPGIELKTIESQVQRPNY